MAINEWKIWKKLGLSKEKTEEEIKVKDDLGAIIAFLREIDVKKLIFQLEKMKEISKEEGVIKEDLKKSNLEKQIKFFDDILQRYDFFQNDADINGLRLKKIGKDLLKKAKEQGMSELVKEKNTDLRWK